jgi:hypothetical protein
MFEVWKFLFFLCFSSFVVKFSIGILGLFCFQLIVEI